MLKLEELKGKKIAILWFGKEGKSNLNFLLSIWLKNITILDKSILTSPLAPLLWEEKGIKVVSWEKYLDNLEEYDYIFKTPWISPYNEKLIRYKDKFLSNSQIFFDNYKWKIIAITWTKGKSTLSTLLFKTLEKAWYKVKLVWNIWTPVLDEINILSWEVFDFVIFEMSSYMLETLKPKTYISVLNNIYDCHLDWHNWRNNYKKAKLNILENAQYKIINSELINSLSTDPLNIWSDTEKDNSNILFFWESWKYTYKKKTFYIEKKQILKDENILLEWYHNRINISAIIWTLDIIWKSNNNLDLLLENLNDVLKTFSWLPHRLENIWTKAWITFIDDAIAVTQESTIAAIETFWSKIWTIFLWWQDSWLDFTNLRKSLEKYNIPNIVLFPDSWNKIFWEFSEKLKLDIPSNLPWKYYPQIVKTNTMKKAINIAFNNTEKWKICLLSCASPSFSLWKGFEEKWDLFRKEIENY